LTFTKFRDIIGQKNQGEKMKNYYYAAYEVHSGKELCLGVWDTIDELGKALRISVKTAYSSLYRSGSSGKTGEERFTVKRVVARNKRKTKKTSKK